MISSSQFICLLLSTILSFDFQIFSHLPVHLLSCVSTNQYIISISLPFSSPLLVSPVTHLLIFPHTQTHLPHHPNFFSACLALCLCCLSVPSAPPPAGLSLSTILNFCPFTLHFIILSPAFSLCLSVSIKLSLIYLSVFLNIQLSTCSSTNSKVKSLICF